MRMTWAYIATAHADHAAGATVELAGFPAATGPARNASYFLLLPEASCCAGHAPQHPRAAVEVFADAPLPMRAGTLRLAGEWRVLADGPIGWRYQLHAARAMGPPDWANPTRRRLLMAAPLICLATTSCAQPTGPDPAPSNPARSATARAAIAAAPPVDIHSHAGGIASIARLKSGVGFSSIRAPMREGGMAVICLAMVADSPAIHMDGPRIRPYRDPAPGELRDHAVLAFDRVLQLARSESLGVIANAAEFRAASAAAPAAIIAAEGADFLEGQIDRLDEAHRRWTLRHLQLTHYRVNELGDIQTEPPVHGGLTDFGAAVVRRCNRLGIVVDVAHATTDLVRRAASVTTKPLVLSHTSFTSRPGPFSRQISAEHAKLIADTGGVIGVWPPAGIYPTLAAMAAGIARLVSVVGIDHVGIGTDLRGLPSGTVFPDYQTLPALAEALLDAGIAEAGLPKILGGNYARVFLASVAQG